ncbi:uncharacterized protein LOC108674182 [Hyalella azteca]|uniref:Uncharacterized protein LOC108674182 n=1 Tax=Hyalella azteca TaxID=294128 RepID=A0A8B7NV48_HYAAZ|nr:uncharacterized protein LOC108674182 [Hyalella azteca]
MKKSVGLVLLLIATFAYSSVGSPGNKKGTPPIKYKSPGVSTSECKSSVAMIIFENQDLKNALSACKSDPKGRAALTALRAQATCRDYEFKEDNGGKCNEVAAPYMKCVAGKLGYLKAGGSIDGAKILDRYRNYAVSLGSRCRDLYDSALGKCGTTISNYAFLGKLKCLTTAINQSG